MRSSVFILSDCGMNWSLPAIVATLVANGFANRFDLVQLGLKVGELSLRYAGENGFPGKS